MIDLYGAGGAAAGVKRRVLSGGSDAAEVEARSAERRASRAVASRGAGVRASRGAREAGGAL